MITSTSAARNESFDEDESVVHWLPLLRIQNLVVIAVFECLNFPTLDLLSAMVI